MRMSYSYFLRFLKNLAIDVLGRNVADHIFGTHILRKTGYLFAIWGVLRGCGDGKREPSDLMMTNIVTSAHHKSAGCVMAYALDAFVQQSGASRAGYDTSRNLVKCSIPCSCALARGSFLLVVMYDRRTPYVGPSVSPN